MIRGDTISAPANGSSGGDASVELAGTDVSAFEAVRLVREFVDAEGAAGLHLASTDEVERWLDVSRTLGLMRLDRDCLVAALLHPLVERGLVDGARVTPAFGDSVASLIDGLTRFGELRELPVEAAAVAQDALQLERLRKLLLAVVDDVRVLIVQLAVTLERLRHIRAQDPALRHRLARESMELYAPLASRLGIWQIKWELEDLAFRELEPDVYMDIARQLNERRVDREQFIIDVVRQVGDALRVAGVDAEVTGRPKHIHGIWRKMQSKSLGFEDVFDLRAIRVLVTTVAECYSTLGVVHGMWTHVPREFDDYVTNPKPNGYRSLHTAVIGPGGRTLEIQIRTREMHAQAELGVAAHWRYKENRDRGDAELERRIAWLRQLLEPRSAGDDAGFIESLSTELKAERVYAFTPRGEIIDLQAGATPLDFAYQIHTDVGHRCRGAKVNGRIVPLTYEIVSGDQIEVLTTREPRPSRDWLNPNLGYLNTSRARAKARQWFKQQDYERHLSDGAEIWDRELRRLGIANPPRDDLLKRFNLAKFDDLLAAMGRGDISTAQLAGALQPYLPRREDAPVVRSRGLRPSNTGDITISGVGNLLTQVAQCCKPLPNDSIVGFITKGRGVSIHRSDCRNVLNLREQDRARLIDVEWTRAAGETYPVDLEVLAYDRKGLLRDVTSLLANEGVNIIGLDSHADERQQTVRMQVTVEVSGIGELSRILDRLGQLGNVFEVQRLA